MAKKQQARKMASGHQSTRPGGSRADRRARQRNSGGVAAMRKESTIAKRVHQLCATCQPGYAGCPCCADGHAANQ